MPLFNAKPRTFTGWADHGETWHSYLDRSARPVISRMRRFLEDWYTHYPVNDQTRLAGSFFADREVHQVGAFWQLYLHESFRRAGWEVRANPVVEQGTPDLLIERREQRFYVEATAAHPGPDREAADNRLDQLRNALARVNVRPWRLIIEVESEGAQSASARTIRRRVEPWLRQLDITAARMAVDDGRFDALPTMSFDRDGWAFSIVAHPSGENHGESVGTNVTVWRSPEMREVLTTSQLRESVCVKASKYTRLDAPLIVAALVRPPLARRDDYEMDALFGGTGSLLQFDPSTWRLQRRDTRFDDGAWTSEEHTAARAVAAVIVAQDISIANIARVMPRLWVNPWCFREPIDIGVPWEQRWIGIDRRISTRVSTEKAHEFWGVQPDWPGDDD